MAGMRVAHIVVSLGLEEGGLSKSLWFVVKACVVGLEGYMTNLHVVIKRTVDRQLLVWCFALHKEKSSHNGNQ